MSPGPTAPGRLGSEARRRVHRGEPSVLVAPCHSRRMPGIGPRTCSTPRGTTHGEAIVVAGGRSRLRTARQRGRSPGHPTVPAAPFQGAELWVCWRAARCLLSGHRHHMSQDIGITGPAWSGDVQGTPHHHRRRRRRPPPSARSPARTAATKAGSAAWSPATAPRARPRSSPAHAAPRPARRRSPRQPSR